MDMLIGKTYQHKQTKTIIEVTDHVVKRYTDGYHHFYEIKIISSTEHPRDVGQKMLLPMKERMKWEEIVLVSKE